MKIANIKAKKGIALAQAFGAVLTLVLVGVLVIIAIFLFATLQTSFASSDGSATNETLDSVGNVTAVAFTNRAECNSGGFSVSACTNITSGDVIATANYTVDPSGTIIAVGDFAYNGQDINCTYTFTSAESQTSCTATESMITQFATYPALVGLVGTIIFLGLVIGVLVASFVFGGRSSV